MLPAAVAIGGVALGVSARLIAKFGARAVLITGLAMLTGALALLLRLPTHARLRPRPAAHHAADRRRRPGDARGGRARHVRRPRGGRRPGLRALQHDAQVGAATGAAVLSTLAAGRTGHLLRSGHSPAEALSGGYHVAFGIGVGLLVAALADRGRRRCGRSEGPCTPRRRGRTGPHRRLIDQGPIPRRRSAEGFAPSAGRGRSPSRPPNRTEAGERRRALRSPATGRSTSPCSRSGSFSARPAATAGWSPRARGAGVVRASSAGAATGRRRRSRTR